MSASETNGSGERRAVALTEKTNVQLGAAVAALVFAGGCIWWASGFTATTNTKLDAVLTEIHGLRDEKTIIVTRVDKLENQIGVMMTLKEMRDNQIKGITDRLERLERKP